MLMTLLRQPRVAVCLVAVLPLGVQAEEVGFDAFREAFNGISPAMPFMAVGENHIVAVSNNMIRFFTKDGTRTYESIFSGQNGFFPGGGTPFAPQVILDPHTGRFIVAGYHRYAFDNLITVCISDDADPNGHWQKYTLNANSVNGLPLFDGDRPTLGVDEQTIYVYTDFYFAGNPFDPFSHGFLFSIDKRALMNGETPNVVAVEPFSYLTAPVAARTYERNAPAQYLVTPYGASASTIRLFAIRDPLGTPVVDTLELAVPAYALVTRNDRMPFLGGGVAMSATDSRMRRAVYRNGSLWTAHHVIEPATGRHQARWYEIAMNDWPVSPGTPTLVQTGEIDIGREYHTFLPDVYPDDEGNAVLVFHHTSAITPVTMARAVRRADDPPGQLQGVLDLRKTEVQLSIQPIYGGAAAAEVDEYARATGWVGGLYWVVSPFGGRSPAMWINSVELPAGLPGDLNCDGFVDNEDIDPFVLAVTQGQAAYQAAWPNCDFLNGDINGDGFVDNEDIDPFVTLLTAP